MHAAPRVTEPAEALVAIACALILGASASLKHSISGAILLEPEPMLAKPMSTDSAEVWACYLAQELDARLIYPRVMVLERRLYVVTPLSQWRLALPHAIRLANKRRLDVGLLAWRDAAATPVDEERFLAEALNGISHAAELYEPAKPRRNQVTP